MEIIIITGSIDNSIFGLFSVAPIAILTALRPMIWEIEARQCYSQLKILFSIVYSFYLIENFTLKVIRILINEPFIMYCFIFSIYLLGVGIASTNFGPWFVIKLQSFLFTMLYLLYNKSKST